MGGLMIVSLLADKVDGFGEHTDSEYGEQFWYRVNECMLNVHMWMLALIP